MMVSIVSETNPKSNSKQSEVVELNGSKSYLPIVQYTNQPNPWSKFSFGYQPPDYTNKFYLRAQDSKQGGASRQ